MKADFQTFSAAITFLFNAAGIATLTFLLNDKELLDLYEELKAQIKVKTSQYGFVLRKRKEFSKKIFSPFVILLHLINFGIILSIFLLVFIGPENLPVNLMSGTIVEPLTLLEKVVYGIWVTLTFLTYLLRCIVPTVKYIGLHRNAKTWLENNESQRV